MEEQDRIKPRFPLQKIEETTSVFNSSTIVDLKRETFDVRGQAANNERNKFLRLSNVSSAKKLRGSQVEIL